MRKNVLLIVLLFFAIVLNGDIFDRLFSTSKGSSITQAEVTLFAIHAIQNRYLNKSKLNPEDLLARALDAIQEEFAEIVAYYDRNARNVTVQIYNKRYLVEVKRLNDLWDIAVVLRQVYSHIEKDYRPDTDREISDVEYVAINGILKKLDPHSYIFTPKEFEDFTSSTEGNFGGLGMVLQTNEDGEITVVSPIEDTPAERAGIIAGDIIVQINDESAINMALNKAVERMRGEPGTKVTIYIKRKGVSSILRFDLERAIIKIQSVIMAMPEKGIGYIKLTSFMENSFQQFSTALANLKKKGMRALILDMRGNSGGLLQQAIKISDIFLDRGVIVSTVGDDDREVSEATREPSDILDIPLVVMVDEGSASATEIVAAALKKNGRAIVVGRRTFGKGSVQNLFRIPRGGGLKLTIAQYLTPGDVSIQTIGVTPDIEYQPSYVDPRKLSLFRTRSHILSEKDLQEHIISTYLPKEIEKPLATVHYLKPYKTPEEILKERRREKVGVFKNDEEIQVTIDLLKMRLTRKEPLLSSALRLREEHRKIITERLEKLDIIWKNEPSKTPPDLKSLKVTLVSGNPLKAGTENILTFRATYPGTLDNLEAVFETDIPPLRNLEIPFGSFTDEVERSVPVSIPEHLPWRRQPVRLDISLDEFQTVARSDFIEVEVRPLEMPEVYFSYLVEDTVGNPNGLVEEGEEVTTHLAVKNAGKGAILDGRIQLINVYNSPEVFISKGTEPIVLKQGEEKEVTLHFKVSSLRSAKSRIGIAVSLYDYKTKYAAGFSIPFVGEKNLSCRFVEMKDEEKDLLLRDNADLYPDIHMSTPVATIPVSTTVRGVGRCGDQAVRIEGGYWVRAADVQPSKKGNSPPLALQRRYPVTMPSVSLDPAPVTAFSPKTAVSFSVSGDDIRDIFVYQNKKKIFYYRIGENDSRRDFTVPIHFREKTNRVTIVAKGSDRERSTTAVKYLSLIHI